MKRFDQINVIPFIDIMLVLLAIVLTTASFISQGLIELDLPDSDSAVAVEELPAVRISINAAGELFFNDEPRDLPALNQAIRAQPEDASFALYVDKQTRFEDFVAVIDLLKLDARNKLSIMTLADS